ncbi:MAG: hypothetical protein AB7O98_00105 [Hyphomonadaceae bacterium]
MTMAPAFSGEESVRGRRRARRVNSVMLDLALLLAACGVCASLAFQGGLEALIGAGIGALMAARRPAEAAEVTSGAFAGLWVGVVFAAFFHEALASVFIAIF